MLLFSFSWFPAGCHSACFVPLISVWDCDWVWLTDWKSKNDLFSPAQTSKDLLLSELTFPFHWLICQLIGQRMKGALASSLNRSLLLSSLLLLLIMTYGLWKEWNLLPRAGCKQGSADDVVRGQNSTSGSPSPGEKGSLIVITSREDPRWRRRPLSWPTSLPLITSCNLSDRPAPLLLLSQPCNYVHLGHATVKDILLNQSFHLHCFISASEAGTAHDDWQSCWSLWRMATLLSVTWNAKFKHGNEILGTTKGTKSWVFL